MNEIFSNYFPHCLLFEEKTQEENVKIENDPHNVFNDNN